MAHGSASNFIRQTVGSSVGTSDPETIDVADASAFPDPSTSQYDIVIWDAQTHNRPDQDPNVEVLTVTGRDTGNNTLTCDRGQQGTTNTSHPDTSDVIIAPLSVGDFNSVRSGSLTTDAYNIGGSSRTPAPSYETIIGNTAATTTSTSYTAVGEISGAYPSLSTLELGTMDIQVTYSGQVIAQDASHTATTALSCFFIGESNIDPITATEASVTGISNNNFEHSVNLSSLASDIQDDVIFFLQAQLKTNDGNFTSELQRTMVSVGLVDS